MQRIGLVATVATTVLLISGSALAEEHRRGPDHRDFYSSRHMVFDNRYSHGHYYPAPGYSVAVLPPGNVSITFGKGRFYFHGGVWYQPGRTGFVVVRPPLGIVVPVLPLGYTTVWVRGMPYYYANDIYYVGGPGNYVVSAAPEAAAINVLPPQQVQMPQAQPPAAAAPPPPVAPAVPAMPAQAAPASPAWNWYYCDSAKGYYPYVERCQEGWRVVPAVPPGTGR